MKKNQKKDQAFLLEQIQKQGDLDLNYADIKDRVNLLAYEKAPAAPKLPRRLSPRVLAVACSLLLVTSALGFGGFMMSRRGPVIDPTVNTDGETIFSPDTTSPQKLPALYPEDVLLWQGDVYVRTDLTVTDNAVGERLGEVISEADSGSQQSHRDNPQAAIASHLEEGTVFHRVEDEENYIAVHSEEGYIIYQRQLIPDTDTP